jgi:rhamnulose-1-phosphate aldolase/alcohol dehydrogenase
MQHFQYVSCLWEEQKAADIAGDEVALLIYRSNLLGADLRLTNFAGGNTSAKVIETDPISGERREVMWVKGSGGDLGTLTRRGCANLYTDRLRALKNRYRGLALEDEMVQLYDHCLFDPKCAAPSIDTPLHGLLPYPHIDHLHPDAIIAIAASQDGPELTRQLWDDQMGWLDWQRPGFDLGVKMEALVRERPYLRGVILGGHGLFTWGSDSHTAYINTLEVVETASAFLEAHYGRRRPVFGGVKETELPRSEAHTRAAALAPILRGLTSSERRTVGHFTDTPRVMGFLQSQDMPRLAALGTSCPDHFLRTKIRPLVLDVPRHLEKEALHHYVEPYFQRYRAEYAAYYDRCRHADSPALRDPNPVVILCPGIGMFTFAKDKQTARVAAEFYTNAINVMRGAEAVSTYTGLSEQEAFNIEYWLLEEAKLQRMPKPKPLAGKIALITGSGGGIGKAIARKYVEEGACVVLNDRDPKRQAAAVAEFEKAFGRDVVSSVSLDVTQATSVEQALQHTALAFGGVDIVVNNAGISISKGLTEHTEADWDQLYDVLVKGQFLVSKAAAEMWRQQGLGGDLVNIVSKNALVAGPNNAGYGSAKAAQAHLSRLLAAELGNNGIRVNVINPDAVIADSNIWAGGWAEGRAKAYGISVDALPAYYAKRTLLNQIILPEDIANACFALVGGLLNKSTGNILNVDGGLTAAFVR